LLVDGLAVGLRVKPSEEVLGDVAEMDAGAGLVNRIDEWDFADLDSFEHSTSHKYGGGR
jgi:hypothetical protein